jgi:hypothetical protein
MVKVQNKPNSSVQTDTLLGPTHSVKNNSVTSKSHAIKLVNAHYFKCMEIDLFLYANPKEGLCGMHAVQACSSVNQYQMVF